MNRRESLMNLGAIGLGMLSGAAMTMNELQKRKIPATGEQLPVIGLGTWQTFDVGSGDEARTPLREVLATLVSSGCSVVDSSPMYGNSEGVVGDLSSALGLNEKLFLATKVWTQGEKSGRDQMAKSFSLLKRKKMDLMQVHNLVDWQVHLKTLRGMKDAGQIRYIGLTHYLDAAHATIEDIFSKHPIDFIQVNYSLGSRHAEQRLLKSAADHGIAVLINRPFEEGALFDRVKGKTLPAWAAEFDCKTWGQFFLKFILSNPHVTAVIPGTSKARHLLDNIEAGKGKLPDARQREQMVRVLA